MILLCQKLIHNRILSERHDTVLILLWHSVKRIPHILLHDRKISLVAVGEIHQKNRCVCGIPPACRHTAQSKDKKKHSNRPHPEIKSAAVTDLTHIHNPFDRHEYKHQHKQSGPQPLFHQLFTVTCIRESTLCRDLPVGLASHRKTHHILLCDFTCSHLIQPGLFRIRCRNGRILLCMRAKHHLLPGLVDIVRQKRSVAQKVDGIGHKHRKLRLQRKIRFPDIKANRHSLHTVMLPVVAGALSARPQKPGSPGGNLIHIGLVDADGKRGKPFRQLTVGNRKHHLLCGACGMGAVLKQHGVYAVLQTALRTGIVNAHSLRRILQSDFSCNLCQTHPCSRLISFFKVGISLSDEHCVHPFCPLFYGIGHIISGQGIPVLLPDKFHGTDLTAQRLPTPLEVLKKAQRRLPGIDSQIPYLNQSVSFIQTDLHRRRCIAVIGETGSTGYKARTVRLRRLIRSSVFNGRRFRPGQKIVGYIAHRIPHYNYPCIKIFGETHGILRAVSVRENDNLCLPVSLFLLRGGTS